VTTPALLQPQWPDRAAPDAVRSPRPAPGSADIVEGETLRVYR